ncbi:helix-turn-helix domain-containing protein [Candidatus Pacearchaeota archaeon]|nr:helix-turn-helix domain-containing protein [Candidatus Pacearchaeota archaeon]
MDAVENIVEAISHGKIVRVSESYARSEGLPILRRQTHEEFQKKLEKVYSPSKTQKQEEKIKPLQYLRKPAGWKEKQVVSELVDNFNWQIKFARRNRGLTRKQFAKMINEPESSLQMLEFGVLPSPDFILLNKVQQALGINLRKDQKDFGQSVKEMIEKAKENEKQEQLEKSKFKTAKSEEDLVGKDIEIADDI